MSEFTPKSGQISFREQAKNMFYYIITVSDYNDGIIAPIAAFTQLDQADAFAFLLEEERGEGTYMVVDATGNIIHG